MAFRYKCVVAYDGYNYMGFQVQEDLPTVELELEKAIANMVKCDKSEISVYSSGRTDRYVHALNQVIHFDLNINISPEGIKRGVNAYLPKDIYIKSVELVDESFHARFSAKSKEYRYYINKGEYNPLTINYAPNITYLNVDLMADAIKLFEGKHDFKGFASASIDPRKDTIKEIYKAQIEVKGDYIEFTFIGSAFLKYQVRRMVGLLIDIGRGKETKDKIIEVLEKCDPSLSHRVADGCGLYLYSVNY